jgi:hypothetical protein
MKSKIGAYVQKVPDNLEGFPKGKPLKKKQKDQNVIDSAKVNHTQRSLRLTTGISSQK